MGELIVHGEFFRQGNADTSTVAILRTLVPGSSFTLISRTSRKLAHISAGNDFWTCSMLTGINLLI
jgi:hypothetical protein